MSAGGVAPSILVVDDDEDIVEMVSMILEQRGWHVVTAADGRQGLEAVAAACPDLILLDMKMPVMDGPTFAAELRRRYKPAPPIVVLTAAADARQCALDIGAADSIAKPFDLAELVGTVERLTKFPARRAL